MSGVFLCAKKKVLTIPSKELHNTQCIINRVNNKEYIKNHKTNTL